MHLCHRNGEHGRVGDRASVVAPAVDRLAGVGGRGRAGEEVARAEVGWQGQVGWHHELLEGVVAPAGDGRGGGGRDGTGVQIARGQ